MKMQNYYKGFIPYALGAFLIGIVGGFSTVLGPAFVQDIGIAYTNTTWTALAQAMSTAACAPILGKMADVLSRKRTLTLGLMLFTLGNGLTALANSLPFMLAARFIVGIGTAAIAPVILAYIVTEFPTDRVAKGFSAYMLISSASVIFGPALGGLMIARWGWRSMIVLCFGLCAAVTLLCLLIKEKTPAKMQTLTDFDGSGGILVLVLFSLILCIPSFGQNFGWTAPAFVAVVLGAVIAMFALIAVERKAKNPILPASFLRRPSFVLSILALFLTQGLLQANMTNAIVFVNYAHPENTTLSGYAISVLYLGMSLGALLLGPPSDRWEPKFVLTGSLILTGLGCAILLLLQEGGSLLLLAVSLGILGLGLGGNGTIFMKIVLTGLSPQQSGSATGTYGLFRDLAAPFGVAVLVPLFTNNITKQLEQGLPAADAALRSIHSLAVVELLCVAAGIITVQFLPRIYHGGKNHEIAK